MLVALVTAIEVAPTAAAELKVVLTESSVGVGVVCASPATVRTVAVPAPDGRDGKSKVIVPLP
jgi:hypothetical protein